MGPTRDANPENPMTAAPDDATSRPFSISSSFNTAAQWTSRQCGRASTFAIAGLVVIIWAVTGPFFNYSDTWQLVINTGTTIVTFLMVFLIQNTQNRDSAVLHLKLDELIRVSESARNKLLDLEDLTEAELERIKGSFTKLAGKPSDAALLSEAADDLDDADAGIQEARKKVASVAARKS
jgi:low affinity Fe/Cu permease